MELMTLRCPNCGADLEIDNGVDTFFCKYCGYKIILDGQSDATLNAKVKIRGIESKERLKREEMHLKHAENKEEEKHNSLILGGVMVLALICFGILGFITISGKKGEKEQEAKLQSIVNEVMADIDNGDYDDARVKASQLYWDSSWTSEPKKKWDKTRETLLDQIEEAERADK